MPLPSPLLPQAGVFPPNPGGPDRDVRANAGAWAAFEEVRRAARKKVPAAGRGKLVGAADGLRFEIPYSVTQATGAKKVSGIVAFAAGENGAVKKILECVARPMGIARYSLAQDGSVRCEAAPGTGLHHDISEGEFVARAAVTAETLRKCLAALGAHRHIFDDVPENG